MPRSVHPVFEYFVYDSNQGISKCVVDDCNSVLKGKHSSNLTKHVQRKHKNLAKLLNEKLKQIKTKTLVQKRKPSFVNVKICRENFLLGCLESIVIDGRPFNLLQGKGLQRMIAPIIEEFNHTQAPISTCPESIQQKGMNACDVIRNEIAFELKGKLISLQLDLTTHMSRSIFGVNVQYYVGDQLKIRTLAMRRLLENTTGLNLAREVEQILHEFGLDVDNIYAITTDNGPNVLACTKFLRIMQERRLEEFLLNQNAETVDMEALMELIDIETQRIMRGQSLYFLHQIHCAAHTLNLVLGDVFGREDIGAFLERFRKLVRALKRPNINNLMTKKGLKAAIIDCDVLWNSIYNMVSATIIFNL